MLWEGESQYSTWVFWFHFTAVFLPGNSEAEPASAEDLDWNGKSNHVSMAGLKSSKGLAYRPLVLPHCFFKLILLSTVVYNAVLVSAEFAKWICYMYIYPLFFMNFLPYLGSPQSRAEFPELHTVGSHIYFIHRVSIVCICQSLSPNSPHPFFPSYIYYTLFVLSLCFYFCLCK